MFPYVFSANKEGTEGYVASSFVRFQVGTEQGVDPCLIPWPFGFEPFQDLTIQANRDGSFRLGQP